VYIQPATVKESETISIYCGKCGTEADYIGVPPDKLLGFMCSKCFEWNRIEREENLDEQEECSSV